MFELNDPVGLIEAMAFIAWADGRVVPEERAALEGLAHSLDLDEAGRAAVAAALEAPPSLASVAAHLRDPVEARFAVSQAILLALADGDFSPIEHEQVRRLAEALGLDSDELAVIEADMQAVYGEALTRAGAPAPER